MSVRDEFAGEWQANTNYYTRQSVTYQGGLYRAAQDHVSGSSFDSGLWVALSLSAGSSSLRVVALGNMGATPTLALNTGDKDVLVTGTLTANATLTVTGLTAGVSITLVLTQDGTGSRTFVFSPTAKKVGGQALPFSTTAGAVDVVTAFSPDGTSLFAFLSGRGMA